MAMQMVNQRAAHGAGHPADAFRAAAPRLPVATSKPVFMWPVPLVDGEVVEEEGEYGGEETAGTSMSHSELTSSDVTSSSHYAYASSSGYTTQNYPVSRDAAERDVSTV